LARNGGAGERRKKRNGLGKIFFKGAGKKKVECVLRYCWLTKRKWWVESDSSWGSEDKGYATIGLRRGKTKMRGWQRNRQIYDARKCDGGVAWRKGWKVAPS